MENKPRATGRVDWRGVDMRNSSFAGVCLQGADLRASDLSGSNFTSADLSYADLRGATLVGTSFQNANLYGCKMQGVEAFHADFRGADMRLCNLGGAYLEGAQLPPPTVDKKQQPLPSPSQIGREKSLGNQGSQNGHSNGRGGQ